MITNVVDKIKRVMGWCPQKDFTLAQTDINMYEHSYAFLANTDAHQGKGTNIIIDYHKDLFKIVSLAAVSSFALIIASLIFPILGFFITLPILVGYAVLLYQERTKVEFTQNSINIQRPLFKPVIIPKDSILKFETVNNLSYTMRWTIPLLVIVMLIYFRKSAIDIFIYMAKNPPFYSVFLSILVKLAVVMILSVLFYKNYIRKKYPKVLKIILKDGSNVIFYADSPQELMNKLEVRH